MNRLSDKELLELIMNDMQHEKDELNKLSAQIDEELAKKSPDYDKIAELSKQYSYLIGADEQIAEREEEHIAKILKAARESKPRRITTVKKFTSIAAAVGIFLLTANFISVAALDMNIFKAVVRYTEGGFSVSFNENNIAEEHNSDTDPYGIRAECEKYGIYPEVPTYLPEGFELSSCEQFDLGVCKDVSFYYENKEEHMHLSFKLYNNAEDMDNTGFPSDYFNIEQIEVNGRPAVTSREDNQYTLVYAQGNILMMIFTQDVPYFECDKITKSIK